MMKDKPQSEAGTSQAEQFWEKHYEGHSQPWSGRANPVLARFTEPLTAGTALDLGCGAGSNALWLAQRGWRVTAVDISSNALKRVATHSVTAGVADRIDLQQHDLARTFPAGAFSLIYAMYLQSPVTLPREHILRRAADAVAPSGLLLIVTHASAAPWSWNQNPNARLSHSTGGARYSGARLTAMAHQFSRCL